jgi:hypothetical protein
MEQAGAETPAGGAGEVAPGTGDDLGRLREALLAAYPETVAELVSGESVGDLLESLERAKTAYRTVAAAIAVDRAGLAGAPAVPAGDGRPLALDPDRLPTVEKIRRGLAGRV